MSCYRKGGCGPYEAYSCSECPASKPEYANKYISQKAVAADVVEVVHGEWKDDVLINDRFPSVRCSECNIRFCDIISNHRCMWYYCPNCGAKMDGGK